MSSYLPLSNPFIGLRPFKNEDSPYFFGRDEQTQGLLELLYHSHFLAVVGSSGSGKSSLVQAGLIPALESGFLVQERDLWKVAEMKPGDTPIKNLASALLKAFSESSDSQKELKKFSDKLISLGSKAAIQYLRPFLEKADSNMLLLIDQFEEVFRFPPQGGYDEAQEFVSILLRLSKQRDIPLFICLTMRSDFLGDCDLFHGLPETLNKSQYLVPRLTRMQRREAIDGPLRLTDFQITPRLLDLLLNENEENRDNLPVLQHALMYLWDQCFQEGKKILDIPEYEKISALHGALDHHSEKALNELIKEEEKIAKTLFQTLTETDASNRKIRRPARLDEIAAIAQTEKETVMKVIQTFQIKGRNFLVLSSEKNGDNPNPLVDISHESLIRQWKRLTKWVEQEDESSKIYQRLAETAELYPRKASLYREAELQLALEWKKRENPNPIWGKRYHDGFKNAMSFLKESRRVDENTKKRDKEQQQKQEREIYLKKSLRKTQKFAVLTTFLLFLTLMATSWAINQSKVIEQQAIETEKLRKEANFNLAKVFEEKALKELNLAWRKGTTAYKNSILYTAAALKQETEPHKKNLNSSSIWTLFDSKVIQSAFSEKWFSPKISPVNSVAIHPKGKTFVSGSTDGTMTFWEMDTGKKLQQFIVDDSDVLSVAFSPDGKILAAGSWNKGVSLWDLKTGKQILQLDGHNDYITDIAFNFDGKFLASVSADSTLILWNVATGRLVYQNQIPKQAEILTSVTFNPEGNILATSSEGGSIYLWDATKGDLLRQLEGHNFSVTSVTFSPDGKTLASGALDNIVYLWKIPTGKKLAKFRHTNSVTSVAFTPDGKTLASGSWDKTIKIWDVKNKKLLKTFTGHTEEITDITFSPDGKTLVSGSSDKTVRVWEETTNSILRHPPKHTDRVSAVQFSPDSKTLVSGSWDNTLCVWEVNTNNLLQCLEGHEKEVTSVAFRSDGKVLVSGSEDNSLRLWEVKTGKLLHKLIGHEYAVTSVSLSPDGKIIASGSNDYSVRLWDADTGKFRQALQGHKGSINSVSFSSDSKTLVSGSNDNTTRLWNVTTGKQEKSRKGNNGNINSVAFSPDDTMVASGSDNATILLWEVNTGALIHEFENNIAEENVGNVTSLAFSPDGKTLISGLRKMIYLWEVSSGRLLHQFGGHDDGVTSVAFSPDGQMIASGSKDQTIRFWDISPYRLFLKEGKPTPLYQTFIEGSQFLWKLKLDELEMKQEDPERTETAQEDYYFNYDQKYRPLLNPPFPGQSKFEQVLQWSQEQVQKF